MELALLGPDLGDVDVEVADRVALELSPLWLVAVCVGQARDAVALQTAMQALSCQVRNSGLQGIETVIQRQEGVTAEGHNDRPRSRGPSSAAPSGRSAGQPQR